MILQSTQGEIIKITPKFSQPNTLSSKEWDSGVQITQALVRHGMDLPTLFNVNSPFLEWQVSIHSNTEVSKFFFFFL